MLLRNCSIVKTGPIYCVVCWEEHNHLYSTNAKKYNHNDMVNKENNWDGISLYDLLLLHDWLIATYAVTNNVYQQIELFIGIEMSYFSRMLHYATYLPRQSIWR